MYNQNDVYAAFQVPEEFLNSNENTMTPMMAADIGKNQNEKIQDKIIDVVADYDVEFAAELDDLVEHKIKVDEVDIDRLRIDISHRYDLMTDLYTLVLDDKPIAEYYIDLDINNYCAKIHFEKL